MQYDDEPVFSFATSDEVRVLVYWTPGPRRRISFGVEQKVPAGTFTHYAHMKPAQARELRDALTKLLRKAKRK